MQWFAFGIAIAISVALAVRWFATAEPEQIVRGLRRVAIVLALLILLGLVITGRLHWLLALTAAFLSFAFDRLARSGRESVSRGPASGRRSQVRTRFLDMSLDHDTGALDGSVIDGAFRGRRLSELSLDELRQLLNEASGDADTVNVLAAYLDRVHGDAWRQADGNGQGFEEGPRARTSDGAMTKEEAFRILGLSPGASDTEIRAAHRRLMKQLHPDHGGSDYLAAKINEAKEILLGQ